MLPVGDHLDPPPHVFSPLELMPSLYPQLHLFGPPLQGQVNPTAAGSLRMGRGSWEFIRVHQTAECVHYSAEQLTRPE